MNRMTEDNLRRAFASESQARETYREFAARAQEDGYGNVARLFAATSYSEEVHAGLLLRATGGVSDTVDNLEEALSGEAFQVQQVYPAYSAVAELQGEDKANEVLGWALEAEKVQVNLYQEAQSAVQAGRDVELLAVFVCPDCGYIAKDQPPERCPLSGTPGREFHGF